MTALQLGCVFSCVDIISSGIASLDLNVYESLKPRGKRIAVEQDLHWILHDEPNCEMTSFTWLKTLQCHALLWGNAYAEIERDNGNRPIALWPRSPNATRPRRVLKDTRLPDGEIIKAGSIIYVTTDGMQNDYTKSEHPERVIDAADMIHVLGLSLDGRMAKSLVDLSRNMIGLALAAEKFGGKFFANGLRPTGVVEMPNTMKPDAVSNFKRSLMEAYGGENILRPIVLESGMTWKEAYIKPNEGQFIESRVHQREEIAAIFHVPVRMLGEAGRTNRASAEQEAIELVQYTLRPWIKAWQPELKRKLFPKRGQTAGKFFPGFYYQDLLTPDAESRGKLISLIKQWGIGNTDDIREFFMDWNPIGGKAGSDYWMPINMQDASDPITANVPSGPMTDNNLKQKPDQDAEASRYIQAYSRLFRAAFERLSNRSTKVSLDFEHAFGPILLTVADVIGHANSLDVEVNGDFPGAEVEHFVREYASGMYQRLQAVVFDDAVCEAETARAINALKIAVYRDLAGRKAAALQ